MNKHIKKYQKIVDELIEKSFPELKGKRIKVFELKITKFYGLYIPFLNWVGVNKFYRNFSKKEVKGILAHELCHAELFKKYNFFKKLSSSFIYWVVPSVRKEEEDKTERRAIEKGYAKCLVLSAFRLEKAYPDCKDKTFMSVRRIKQYAKEIGK